MYLELKQGSINRKKTLYAYILNLMMPGVGLLYWGRKNRGAYWVCFVVISFVVGLILCFSFSLHPQIFMWVAGVIWIYAQFNLGWYIHHSSPAVQPWSRYSNSIFSYFMLAFLGLIPILLTLHLSFTRLYTFIRMRDNSMFPQILSGDLIAVDRRVYQNRLPTPGDLIAIECPSSGPTITRVITTSKETQLIKIKGERILLNNTPLFYQEVNATVPLFTEKENKRLKRLRFYYEKFYSKGKKYLTSYPKYPGVIPSEYEKNLRDHMFFVLPDVRDFEHQNISCVGIIDRARILGAPQYIYSHQSRQSPYSSRSGLRLE